MPRFYLVDTYNTLNHDKVLLWVVNFNTVDSTLGKRTLIIKKQLSPG